MQSPFRLLTIIIFIVTNTVCLLYKVISSILHLRNSWDLKMNSLVSHTTLQKTKGYIGFEKHVTEDWGKFVFVDYFYFVEVFDMLLNCI